MDMSFLLTTILVMQLNKILSALMIFSTFTAAAPSSDLSGVPNSHARLVGQGAELLPRGVRAFLKTLLCGFPHCGRPSTAA